MKWARLLAYIIGCTRPQAARQILLATRAPSTHDHTM
jgi:hypothetical protein